VLAVTLPCRYPVNRFIYDGPGLHHADVEDNQPDQGKNLSLLYC